MAQMRDEHVARKLQKHDSACIAQTPEGWGKCDCDWPERVHNTLLILKTIRVSERRECERIAREAGSARAADMIRDRDQNDD
jgi:hypothetical protein